MSTECLSNLGWSRPELCLGVRAPKPLIVGVFVFFLSAKILTQLKSGWSEQTAKQRRLFRGKGSCKGLSVICICVQGILFSRVLFCLHLVLVLGRWVMSAIVNTWEAHSSPLSSWESLVFLSGSHWFESLQLLGWPHFSTSSSPSHRLSAEALREWSHPGLTLTKTSKFLKHFKQQPLHLYNSDKTEL